MQRQEVTGEERIVGEDDGGEVWCFDLVSENLPSCLCNTPDASECISQSESTYNAVTLALTFLGGFSLPYHLFQND